MTDEESDLVKVTLSMSEYYHCLYSFSANQLTVRQSHSMSFAVVDSIYLILILIFKFHSVMIDFLCISTFLIQFIFDRNAMFI